MKTLNERFLELLTEQIGDDSTFAMLLTMFQGNILSIPEVEFRSQMEKYLKLLTELLN